MSPMSRFPQFFVRAVFRADKIDTETNTTVAGRDPDAATAPWVAPSYEAVARRA